MPNPEKFELVRRVGRSGVHFCIARLAGTNRCFFGSDDGHVHEVDPTAEKPEPIRMGPPRVDPAETAETDRPQPVENAPDAAADDAAATGHSSWVTGLAVAGNRVVSGGWDRRLIWWDADGGERVSVVEDAHAKWIRRLAASPDGKWVASVGDDMVCRLWDAGSGRAVRDLNGHAPRTPHDYPNMLYAVAFSPNGEQLATADKTGHIIVWNVADGRQLAGFESPENYTWDPRARRHSIGGIRSVSFSPDGNQLAVGGIGQIGNVDHLDSHALVQTYDWREGTRLHRFAHGKHKGLVERIAWNTEATWLFAAGGANGGFTFFADLTGEPQGPQTEDDPKKFAAQPTGKFLRDDDPGFHVHDFVPSDDFSQVFAVGHGNFAVWKLA